MALSILSPSDQVASHLREQLLSKRWAKELPGTPALATEFGIDRKTIIAAIHQLEEEELLIAQGIGRPRLVNLPKTKSSNALKIRIMPYDDEDRERSYILTLIHQLKEQGHSVSMATKNLLDMKMEVSKISRYMENEPADLWIPIAASRDLLEWFIAQEIPVFAFFGRRRDLPMGSIGPDKGPALIKAIQRLIAYGHRRIVYLTREERRKPEPGYLERLFLKQLESHGIITGQYNLPDWEESAESFNLCIDKLFMHTPPTALIFDEAQFLMAASYRLAQSNIFAPRDISLICQDSSHIFDWCQPQISHITWNPDPLVAHTVEWVKQFSLGKQQREAIFTEATFLEGGTIGPVRR